MIETWANLTPIPREPQKYISPEEYKRMERVAVGKICRCGNCICCEEARKDELWTSVK